MARPFVYYGPLSGRWFVAESREDADDGGSLGPDTGFESLQDAIEFAAQVAKGEA